MADVAITPHQSGERFVQPSEARHRFEVTRLLRLILEVDDIHFHNDSAVMMPDFFDDSVGGAENDERISGIAVVLACYLHSQDKPEQAIVINGHADTVGASDYNLALSRKRAENVLHLLLGEREKWVQTALAHNHVEDHQQILKFINQVRGFGCDPGPVNNVQNAATQRAVRIFQERFNERFGRSIKVTGTVTPETWGAFFDVYVDVLKELLRVGDAGMDALRAGLHFVDSAKRAVGCGENFPIEEAKRDNFRSKVNRRVEINFFKPQQEPKTVCHPSPGACTPAKCEINNPKVYRTEHIHVDRLRRDLRIRLFDEASNVLPGAPFGLTVRGKQQPADTADDKGELLIKGAVPGVVTVRWNRPNRPAPEPPPEEIVAIGRDGKERREKLKLDPPPEFEFQRDIFLDLQGGTDTVEAGGETMTVAEASRRLSNLGYPSSDFDADLRAFQRDCGDPETGALKDAEEKLRRFHDLDVKPPGEPQGDEEKFAALLRPVTVG